MIEEARANLERLNMLNHLPESNEGECESYVIVMTQIDWHQWFGSVVSYRPWVTHRYPLRWHPHLSAQLISYTDVWHLGEIITVLMGTAIEARDDYTCNGSRPRTSCLMRSPHPRQYERQLDYSDGSRPSRSHGSHFFLLLLSNIPYYSHNTELLRWCITVLFTLSRIKIEWDYSGIVSIKGYED